MGNSPYIEPHSALIKRAGKGDESALYELHQLYAKAMLNTAHRLVGTVEDAEDVLQESFVKAFSKLDQFQFKSSFGAWLKRIVVNQSLNHLEKRKGIKMEEWTGNDRPSLPEPEDTGDFEYTVEDAHRALHELPTGYRTVLSLYLLEGYDHQEIAQILNIGVSTSISQLSRGKKQLIRLMQTHKQNGPIRTAI